MLLTYSGFIGIKLLAHAYWIIIKDDKLFIFLLINIVSRLKLLLVGGYF